MNAIILNENQYTELVAKLDEINIKLNSNSADKEKFLDNQEFIQLMKISKRTAQTWRDEGKIAFSQVGSKIYYKLEDIEGLLKGHYHRAFNRKPK